MDSLLSAAIDLAAATSSDPFYLGLGNSRTLSIAPEVAPGQNDAELLSAYLDFSTVTAGVEVRVSVERGVARFLCGTRVSRGPTPEELSLGRRGLSQGAVVYEGPSLKDAVASANTTLAAFTADGYTEDIEGTQQTSFVFTEQECRSKGYALAKLQREQYSAAVAAGCAKR